MKKTLLTLAVALLLAAPACLHHRGGPGGGPGRHGGDCPQHRRADCPCPEGAQGAKADCPKWADCPKGRDAQKAPMPCPGCPNAPQK